MGPETNPEFAGARTIFEEFVEVLTIDNVVADTTEEIFKLPIVALDPDKTPAVVAPTTLQVFVNNELFAATVQREKAYTRPSTVFNACASASVPLPAIYTPVSLRRAYSSKLFFTELAPSAVSGLDAYEFER